MLVQAHFVQREQLAVQRSDADVERARVPCAAEEVGQRATVSGALRAVAVHHDLDAVRAMPQQLDRRYRFDPQLAYAAMLRQLRAQMLFGEAREDELAH